MFGGTTRTPSGTRVTQRPTILQLCVRICVTLAVRQTCVTLPRVVIYGQAIRSAASVDDCRSHTALQLIRFNVFPDCEVQFVFYWFMD